MTPRFFASRSNPIAFILPTLHFFHSHPRLPSENGGVFDRTTEKLKWNRYTLPFFALFFILGGLFAPVFAQENNEKNLPESLTPIPREDVWWREKFEANRLRLENGPVDLLFLGDSIVETLDGDGVRVWDYYNGDRNAMTMGFGGDRTEHLLWRLENLPMEKIAPHAIVLLIGSNNLYTQQSDEEIAQGMAGCAEKLRALYPAAPILMLGITPEHERPDHEIDVRMPSVNALAAEKVKNIPNLTFRSIGHLWCDENGRSTLEMTRDHCHPTEKGCAVWLAEIEPILAEWLKTKPKKPM